MPFTPFHFGFGYAAAAVEKRPKLFCFYVFVIAQVVIDVETLVNMIQRAHRLHTFFHTFLGSLVAALIAVGVGWLVYPFGAWILEKLPGKFSDWVRAVRFFPAQKPGWVCLGISALVGAWSHVVFDALMHSDITPFAPFTNANPMQDLIGVGELHLACLLLFLAGYGWIGLRRLRAKK